ncbi:PTS system, fructose-specific IIABC component [Spiroplasma clarkii]|uniref:PTS system, fructose-specific IIA component n=1 Tax=Spiroplasma clarkii TaxID=2139 RepID=A0A1Y0L013_9MOLU|nr:fructose PTS transporter subunit IIB [Spiroplasma clarkii]ARU91352.1 PTS system, fructose-specific IIABC component [Spiroplasma clarkii]ATX70773.1 PTS system, fructose-specific IIA component [Spiroplasma clarkii]
MKYLFKNFSRTINRDQALKEIANLITDSEVINSNIVDGFIKREEIISTGIGNQIAIPHCQVAGITDDYLVFLKVKKQIDWNSLDEKPVEYIFGIVTQENSDKHLEIIAFISNLLIDAAVKSKIINVKSQKDFVKLILDFKNEKQNLEMQLEEKTTLQVNNYDIVAITCCPSGLAHTFIAEKILYNYGREENLKVKVETRGRDGIQNKLTKDDVKNAKIFIQAIDRPVVLEEYYNLNKNIIKTSTVNVVNNLKKVISNQRKNKSIITGTEFYTAFVGTTINLSFAIKLIMLVLGLLSFLKWYLNVEIIKFESLNLLLQTSAAILIAIYSSYILASLFGETKFWVTLIAFIPSIFKLTSITAICGSFIYITVGLMIYFQICKLTLNKINKQILKKNLIMIADGLVLVIIFLTNYLYLLDYLKHIDWVVFKTFAYLNQHWYINQILVFLLLVLYTIDLGGKINKVSMMLCYNLILFSLSQGLLAIYLYSGTVLLFAPTFPNLVYGISALINKDKKYFKILMKDTLLPKTESCQNYLQKNGKVVLLSLILTYLLMSFGICYLKIQYFIFLSSPLGALIGFLYQPVLFWGVAYLCVLFGTVAFGVLVNEIILKFQGGYKNEQISG